ncbi:aspartyl-phosphate phosphatase Spo0E family protein [Paenibacillus sp. P26]|nr:aspartyl-phosphate phosphatase Spo0E family protein [Paenibacillus sp. P26]UUZ94864.1 aspartyl-phosphate phosphatase Spo0E family protein [Paenibacillus sp. P25]
MADLQERIEHLRSELVRMVENAGNFVDVRVVSLSQELDQALLEFEFMLKEVQAKKRYVVS